MSQKGVGVIRRGRGGEGRVQKPTSKRGAYWRGGGDRQGGIKSNSAFKPGSHLCDKHKHKHKLATFSHMK